MKRPTAHIVGDLAQSQLTVALQLAGCSVGLVSPDYGEDLAVELPEDEELSGARIFIQLKGTGRRISPSNGRVAIATVTTAHLRKWAGTVVPVALVCWNVTAKTGYYVFVNTPTSFLCTFAEGQRSKKLFASEQQRISSRTTTRFIRDALLSHRLNLELLEGTADFHEPFERVPVSIIRRNAEILVALGIIRRVITQDDETAYEVPERTKTRYIELIERLSDEHPSWYADDIVRRAATFLVHQELAVHRPADVRLTHGCLRVLWPMLGNHDGIAQVVSEWGHPLHESTAGNEL